MHSEKKGVSHARNIGISKASGDFIQFADADDYLEPEMTEMLVDAMVRENADLVICGYKKYQNDKVIKVNDINRIYDIKNDSADEFFKLYNKWLINMPWNKLFKRKMIKKNFNEKMNLGEDLYFNLDYIEEINQIAIMDYCGYNYIFTTGNSLAGSFNKDKLEISKKLHKRVEDFAIHVLNADKDVIKDYAFLQEVRFSMTNLVRSNLAVEEKKELIKKWCNDPVVIKGYKDAGMIKIFDYILGRLIIYKQSSLIYFILNKLL